MPTTDGDFGERLKAHYLDYIQSIRALPIIPFEKNILKVNLRWAGLDDQKIATLKQAQQVSYLPLVYEQVLRVMGEADGGIAIVTRLEVLFGSLQHIKQELLRQINFQRRDGIVTPDLPTSAFVFACRAGQQFFFFETEPVQDDPPVYYFENGISKFIPIADTLSSWFWEHSLDPWAHINAIRKQQSFPTFYSHELAASAPRDRNIRHQIVKPESRGEVPAVDHSFGEKLREHYRAHIQAARTSTETSFSTTYLYRDHFEGLSNAEIDNIQQAQSVDFLPLAFRQFLQVMGRGDGNIFVGCDRSLDFLLNAKMGLQEILEISSQDFETPELPTNAVVFLAIQGVEFFFFEATKGVDDPPIWLYLEDEAIFYQVSSTLSAWLWEQAFDPMAVVKPIDD